MKKYFAWLGVFVLAVGAIYAAAPAGVNVAKDHGDFTASTAYTSTAAWQNIDSLVIVASDSAATIISVTGQAVMDPGDKLRIGLGSVKTDTVPTFGDTLTIYNPLWNRGAVIMPFSYQWLKSNNAALTDTIYVFFAVGGSSTQEKIAVKNLYITACVQDQ